MKIETTPYKQDPTFLDEIIGEDNIGNSIHIERMSEGDYWFRLNEWEFKIVASKDEVRIYETTTPEQLEKATSWIGEWSKRMKSQALKRNLIRNRKKKRK